MRVMASFSSFRIRSKYTFKLLTWVILLLFIYNEFISYWILPFTWIKQPDCPASHCKKILLVSDPQIIGPEWRFFLIDFLAKWDSDCYLRKTFLKAVNYVNPDIIIFLGDLMDQGHTASDPEFQYYVKRLKSLFELPSSLKNTKVIILPGDNDIGGIEDILVLSNVERFDKIFNQTEECTMTELIEFCKINLMTSIMQESKFKTEILRVALSHAPLTPKQSYFLKEVVKKIKPSLIFSGHLHTSSHYAVYENDVWSYRHSTITPKDTKSKIYKFHEGLIHEIIVPTCSYRMGVYNMGYGVAVIDTKKQMLHYSVLWLPHRLVQIFIYSVIALSLIVSVLLMALKRRFEFKNVHRIYSFLP